MYVWKLSFCYVFIYLVYFAIEKIENIHCGLNIT